MNSKNLAGVLMILILAVSTGCANTPEAELEPASANNEFSELADHYRQRAERSKNQKDWYMAREFLKVADRLDPENTNPGEAGKLDLLSRLIMAESDLFYKKGVVFYGKGEKDKAMRAFLEALRINPEHKGAISYMIEKRRFSERKIFEVKEETDLEAVAEEVYDDPSKKFLIAYFNDMEKSSTVKAGKVLLVPPVPKDWDRIAAENNFDIEKNLAKAREHLEAEQYENAIELAAKIQEHDPENAVAGEIKSEAWLQIARNHEEFKKYREALDAMANVDPDYKPAQIYMAHLQKTVKALAEEYYKTGVQHFVNENLEQAIIEWEKVLALDPNNQKARQDIENAKKLLEKLGKIK